MGYLQKNNGNGGCTPATGTALFCQPRVINIPITVLADCQFHMAREITNNSTITIDSDGDLVVFNANYGNGLVNNDTIVNNGQLFVIAN